MEYFFKNIKMDYYFRFIQEDIQEDKIVRTTSNPKKYIDSMTFMIPKSVEVVDAKNDSIRIGFFNCTKEIVGYMKILKIIINYLDEKILNKDKLREIIKISLPSQWKTTEHIKYKNWKGYKKIFDKLFLQTSSINYAQNILETIDKINRELLKYKEYQNLTVLVLINIFAVIEN